MPAHSFTAQVVWTGNRGAGTQSYRAYAPEYEVRAPGKPTIPGSADPALRGDGARWNPEDSLIGSLSACHMLWFLFLASQAGWVVESYEDDASGTMEMNPDGSGQFTEVVLAPRVTISAGDPGLSDVLHDAAYEKCFIARSVNFPIRCEGKVAFA